MSKAVRPLLLLSVALYAASLTQTAFCYFNSYLICESGFSAFLGGALLWPAEINSGGKYGVFTWWANVALVMGWSALWFRAPRWVAFLWCAASLAIAPWHLQVEFHSNGWTGGRIVNHDAGFWLWLASMGSALIASLFLPRSHLLLPWRQLFLPWKQQQPTALGVGAPEAGYAFDWRPVLFKALGETQLRPVARCTDPDLAIWMCGNIPAQTRLAHVLCAEGLAIFTIAYVPATGGTERWIVMDEPVSFWPAPNLPDAVTPSRLIVWQPFAPDGKAPLDPTLSRRLRDLILPALRRWPA